MFHLESFLKKFSKWVACEPQYSLIATVILHFHCNRGPDGDAGIEGNSGSDGKGKWSEMVQSCVEEGWWACSEKSIGVQSKGQEEARTTKEDVEDASGEREEESRFGEKGCHESSEMESGSYKNCWQSGVNPATLVYGDKPGSKLDWLIVTKQLNNQRRPIFCKTLG